MKSVMLNEVKHLYHSDRPKPWSLILLSSICAIYFWPTRSIAISAVPAPGNNAALAYGHLATRCIAAGGSTCTTTWKLRLLDEIIAATPIELWPQVVTRSELPDDVAAMIRNLSG